MPQNPPPPSQSTGSPGGSRPNCISSRFRDPKRERSCRKPIAPTNGGIIIGSSSRLPNNVLPRNFKRVITQANGRVSPVVSPVVRIASAKLLPSDSRCSGLENRKEKKRKLKRPFATNAPLSDKPAGYNRNNPKNTARNPRK